MPNIEKLKYMTVVYHLSDMEIDGICCQSQACAWCKSDVQKCTYFRQMVHRDRPLKTPSSCSTIFLIRSLCNVVLPDMLLPLPLTSALYEGALYIHI
jgi:hypothetical protein